MPQTANDFWAANPEFAKSATKYLQSHATDQGLQKLAVKSPRVGQALGLKGNKQQVAKEAGSHITKALQQLTSNGLSPEQAHNALYSELLSTKMKMGKSQKWSSQSTDPIEQLYQDAGDPSAEAIVKLGGTLKDPFQALATGKAGKGIKGSDRQNALFSAAFAKSDLGRKALTAQSPQVAATAAKQQVEQQIVDQYKSITQQGGVADLYDQYLQDQAWRQTATAAEKRAAGPAMKDPLTELGYSRAKLGVPEGQMLSGSTIRSAAAAQVDKERQSLRGIPIAGTQVAGFVKKLEGSGPIGKALAKLMSSGALTGSDAWLAQAEWEQATKGGQTLPKFSQLDKTLRDAVMQASKNTSQLGKDAAGVAASGTGTGAVPSNLVIPKK